MTTLLKYLVWEKEEEERESFEVWGEGGGVLCLAAWTKDWGDIGFILGFYRGNVESLAVSGNEGNWLRFLKTVNLFSLGFKKMRLCLYVGLVLWDSPFLSLYWGHLGLFFPVGILLLRNLVRNWILLW